MNNKELGYTFDLNNTYYGPMCIKYGNAQIVKLGKKTGDVYLVQGIVRAKGYYKGCLDGDCGEMTDKSIRNYQKACGLTIDGECGLILGINYSINKSRVDNLTRSFLLIIHNFT